ncbi:hypothetical protein ABH920_006204 [Catenulispora sp. EB89]|uniref:hypothetical protein n=1 Tax=Catenulispora sp. EB89 TaxID=3156257 RepID=UPI003513C84C
MGSKGHPFLVPTAAFASLVLGLLSGAAPASAAWGSATGAPTTAPNTAVTASPISPTTARAVTLITGDRVSLTTSGGRTSAQLTSAAGTGPAETYTARGGDEYVVPAVAKPYLGRQLDPALFDISALLRDNLAGGAHIPVAVTYTAGTTPSALPGVTLTSVGGQSASGYVTAASTAEFTAGLRAAIGADVRAGRPVGSGALFGGVSGVSLAAGAATGPITPHYVMHEVQIALTDTAGNPLTDQDVHFEDLDNLLAGYADVPIDDGVGKVTLPAGHYLATSQIFDFDSAGDETAIHWIDELVTVPSAGTATTSVALSETAASSLITVSTPRPSTQQALSVSNYYIDTAGLVASTSIIGISDTPVYVNPMATPAVGSVRYQIEWSGIGPTTGSAYRYDVAFGSGYVPADESYVVQPRQLAKVTQTFYADPAGGTDGRFFNAAYDAATSALQAAGGLVVSAGVVQAMPSTVTEYLGTADSGEWDQSVVTPDQTQFFADNRTFTAGRTAAIEWAHGPLGSTMGQHTGVQRCYACTAGAALTMAFYPVGDSEPDHSGLPGGGNDAFAFYQNGTLVYSGSAPGVELDGIATAPATYRAVDTSDLSDVPGMSQSTNVVTDLTVGSATSVPLPGEDTCYGQSVATPCLLLPALTLNYQLETDRSNTSADSLQVLELGVGHVAFDCAGSHAAITSATVTVSFDGGKSWEPTSSAGSDGHYIVAWDNPASAKGADPELRVSATDAIGGSITQTIANAYTVAK